MITENQATSVKTNFNDVTGDTIVTKQTNQKAYAEGWDRIFGNKEKEGKEHDV